MSKCFCDITQYFLHPLILITFIPDKPLIIYISVQEWSLGSFLAQENEEGKRALDYLSRNLIGAMFNYSPIEKMRLIVIFSICKALIVRSSHELILWNTYCLNLFFHDTGNVVSSGVRVRDTISSFFDLSSKIIGSLLSWSPIQMKWEIWSERFRSLTNILFSWTVPHRWCSLM